MSEQRMTNEKVSILRRHAAICKGAVEVKVVGDALKEHAAIFDGAADEIERLNAMMRRARNIIIDAQNFIGPTTIYRDEETMIRNIERFIEDTRP
jgi:cytochrome c551/c552